jgi:hypothetical protein
MLSVPWALILKQAPGLISAATGLLIKSRRTSADIITAKDLNALRDQYAASINRPMRAGEACCRPTQRPHRGAGDCG